MSERSPWATSFIYCRDCARGARRIFTEIGDGIAFDANPNDAGSGFTWLAGMLRNTADANEAEQVRAIDAALSALCHPLRWCVMSDSAPSAPHRQIPPHQHRKARAR